MTKIIDFIQLFNLYRKHNPLLSSARIAYGIAFRGLPF